MEWDMEGEYGEWVCNPLTKPVHLKDLRSVNILRQAGCKPTLHIFSILG